MNIGILTYNGVFNFGANLQAISTASHLKKQGFNPIFINWSPTELDDLYAHSVSEEQKNAHRVMKLDYMNESDICRTDDDVINVIESNNIEGIIVGSDAVLQHFEIPLKTKLKGLIKPAAIYKRYTRDRMFPNPFWGSFYKKLKKEIPIVIMSGSSQNANYSIFNQKTMTKMTENLKNYSYISVRDSWTSNMIAHITKNKIKPVVTPDPVFGFNHNVPEVLENSSKILARFNLPEKYLLVSFKKKIKGIDEEWMANLEKEAKARGYELFALPLPEKLISYGVTKSIDLPISPIEWYTLIANSVGYIGQNMHPIVVSLHNANPFFSFDYYGLSSDIDKTDSSSKISHILKTAGFSDYRISSVGKEVSITPNHVLDKIESFDKEKCKQFSDKYLKQYLAMMNEILPHFSK